MGCSPWGRYESDTTERLHFDFSLSCIGEGDGNPFQCSCLENPRDGGAWWAAVYGVTQSRTRLKRLSSSSSMYHQNDFRKTYRICQGLISYYLSTESSLNGMSELSGNTQVKKKTLGGINAFVTCPPGKETVVEGLTLRQGLLSL